MKFYFGISDNGFSDMQFWAINSPKYGQNVVDYCYLFLICYISMN